MVSCTRWRLTARQIWPWCRNEPHAPGGRRRLDVRVLEHDQRAVAAQLEHERLSLRPAASPTLRPVAVEPVNEIILTFGSSTSAWPTSAPPGEHVQHALGQPGLLEDARHQHAAADRRVRIRLEHDRVAQRERRRRPSASPARTGSSRADHADHADRHAPRRARPPRRHRRQHRPSGCEISERGRLVELADRGADLVVRLGRDRAGLADQPALELRRGAARAARPRCARPRRAR